MDKFSNIKPKSEFEVSDKDKILFSNDYVKLIEYEDWTIIKEFDSVICIPYLIEMNQVIMRYEYIPTFKYVDGQEHHLTVISGAIERGETKERSLLRELEEEAGIVLRPDFNIEFLKPMFVSKGHTSKYHPCLLNLTESDYSEVVIKGDGTSAEKKSKSIKIDSKYISSINSSDMPTEFMLNELKKHLNIQ